ncbi:hypothetical protein IFR05_001116 [Cadophora sp. M221]|nr:hypothetical protein IFR05_001116 [Cadophora sp. M221]
MELQKPNAPSGNNLESPERKQTRLYDNSTTNTIPRDNSASRICGNMSTVHGGEAGLAVADMQGPRIDHQTKNLIAPYRIFPRYTTNTIEEATRSNHPGRGFIWAGGNWYTAYILPSATGKRESTSSMGYTGQNGVKNPTGITTLPSTCTMVLKYGWVPRQAPRRPAEEINMARIATTECTGHDYKAHRKANF